MQWTCSPCVFWSDVEIFTEHGLQGEKQNDLSFRSASDKPRSILACYYKPFQSIISPYGKQFGKVVRKKVESPTIEIRRRLVRVYLKCTT